MERTRYMVEAVFKDDFGKLCRGDLPTFERIATWKNVRALVNSGYLSVYGGERPPTVGIPDQEIEQTKRRGRPRKEA